MYICIGVNQGIHHHICFLGTANIVCSFLFVLCHCFISFKQLFDKEVKGFVYSLDGSSQTHKMQLPKDGKMAREFATINQMHCIFLHILHICSKRKARI